MNLREFGSWGLEQGSVGNPVVNTYVGQCVSLIQQYLYLVFGVTYKARGNAKDWEYISIPGFEKLPANVSLEKGDILVYGSEYGGGYGHIGLIDINNKYYDQNGIKKLAIGYTSKPYANYRCIFRSIDKSKIWEEDSKEVKALDEVATDVINGLYGNGQDRIDKLTNEGYDADKVQVEVNKILNSNTSSNSKSVTEVAKEVIKGLWGNGQDRIDKLTKAGYNANAVQAEVNRLLK